MYSFSVAFASVLLAATGATAVLADDAEKGPQPSALSVKTSEPLTSAGKPGVTQFGSQDDVDKAFGKGKVTLERPIDFAKEELVFVRWGTSGPPFGDLKFKSSPKEGISFYVQEPNVQVRGQAYKLGADWFTVPKGTKVSLVKGVP